MTPISDVRKIRELFIDFFIEEVATGYTMPGAHRQKRVVEPLIRNYTWRLY